MVLMWILCKTRARIYVCIGTYACTFFFKYIHKNSIIVNTKLKKNLKVFNDFQAFSLQLSFQAMNVVTYITIFDA